MKWKWLLSSILAVGLMTGYMTWQVSADPVMDHHKPECKQDVKLSNKQLKKLDKLSLRVYESHKALWEEMGEYQLLSPEQVNKRIAFMKKHLDHMQKHQYQWCKKHKTRDASE